MDLISIKRKNGLSVEIGAQHRRVTSSPEPGRESSDGFTPSELLAGSLGACIAMDIQRYCDELGYREGEVTARVAFQLLGHPQRIGAIGVDVEVPSDLPEGGRQILRRIIEQCRVSQTLRNPPAVDVGIKRTAK